ncbi:MAG: hypothetical protein AAB719_02260 [Patescibacteria group bacterium]
MSINSLRDAFITAEIVQRGRANKIARVEDPRKKLLDRLNEEQARRAKGWRQSIIELLIPATSPYEFRKVALGILLVCPEAIEEVANASCLFKNERGGQELVQKIREIKKDLRGYYDLDQHKWFLKEKLGVPRRAPKRFSCAVS